MEIRQPNVAGSFYPGHKNELETMVKEFFNKARTPTKFDTKKITALISPHAGYIYSGIVAASGYKLLAGKKYKNIIVLGPSHFAGFEFAALDNTEAWMTPLGTIKLNSTLINKINDGVNLKIMPQVFEQEHSLEVQLPFLQTVLNNFSFVPILCGQNLNHQAIAYAISSVINDDTLVVASSDLSHYLPLSEAGIKDKKSVQAILSLDSNKLTNNLDACGQEGIIILNELAKIKSWKAKLIDWCTSAETSGDASAVVGYASIIYTT